MNLKSQITKIHAEVEEATLANLEAVENFRIHYLGRKGILADLFELFKQIPSEEKKEVGQLMN
ncbi:MAG: phenylalanine--tRNA ligase subunit alpha, partial [Bacteroidota bacterium]